MGSKNEKDCEKCLSISHSFFYHMPEGKGKKAGGFIDKPSRVSRPQEGISILLVFL